MFSTDLDFRVNLDGLESFIRSRLTNSFNSRYYFSAREIPLDEYDNMQLIRLSVEFPWWMSDCDDEKTCTTRWAMAAIDEILLPAYMWIFAEIGIANPHGLSTYFRTNVFDLLHDDTMVPMPYWTISGFIDGVKLLPKSEMMSGNYGDGWAQFRFVLSDARNFGYSNEYIDSLKRELNSESGED